MKRPATFLRKIAVAAVLIALADLLLYGRLPGALLGVFALAWTLALPIAVPALRRRRPALAALAAATLFGCVLVDDPGLLGWTLFWLSLSSAALLARRGFDDAARQCLRIVTNAAAGLVGPLLDAGRVNRLPNGPRPSLRRILGIAVLPVVGGAVFVALFAAANPIIESALDAVQDRKSVV